MISRRYKKNKIKFKYKKKVIFFILITFVLLVIADISMRSSINKAIDYQSKIIAINILSNKTLEEMDRLNVTYEDLITIKRDSNNKVTSIETNIKEINKVKMNITKTVTDALNEIEIHSYKLSLGTLLGNDYLAGRGPKVTLKITPSGYLNTELISQFKSVGINQTSHQIILKQSIDLTTIVPLHNSTTKIDTNIIIAETIIVGEVPQYYTNVISEDKQMISDLNDYIYNKIKAIN